MHPSGIPALDHAPQVAAEWLNLLQQETSWTDRSRTYALLRATLHALRDFLTVDEAADLAAQLPLLIRGIFFEGWVPSRTPATGRSVDDFLDRVMAEIPGGALIEPDAAVSAVFSVLRQRISEGEFEQITHALRKPLRQLWI